MGEHLHSGRPLLLGLTGSPAPDTLTAPYADRLTLLTTTCPTRPTRKALLVRPDGFVAWAADTDGEEKQDQEELVAALERWVGGSGAGARALTRG
ncbi:hypothetical protein [Streptomyces griseofuscus]|uniref:aromatic-ring hydroxylase C-terminal domain-containing protein n=1 Tax=Streptomyces griseofuscus TaxID=146922 RepID=UPI0037B2E26A